MELLGPSGPSQVGPFRVLGVLGEGGMGRVLLGAAPDGRLVAVKQVLARFAADDGFRARFRREVAASRKVSGAYTAAVMEADADAETPWLASVFVSGPSLGAAVAAVGALPEETVRRLAAGLASALAEIHRAGLVHRDLKPENVLLAEDGVRVIDLGIARAAESGVDTRLTHTGLVIGSPPFMSPEQAEGRELTAASDVFSLGSVLFLAVTGRHPFAGSSTLQTLYDVVHAEPDLGVVPAGLREVVERCLAKDPGARPSPAELFALLGRVVPAGRQPWPPAVHRMIADQAAAIDRLLGGDAPARTTVEPPAPEPEPEPVTIPAEVMPEPEPEPEPVAIAAEVVPEPVRAAPSLVPLPEEPPVTVGSLAPGTRRPPYRSALRVAVPLVAAAGVLGAAGFGVWAYGHQPGQWWGETVHTNLDRCETAGPKLPVPPGAERASALDTYLPVDGSGPNIVVRCYWFGGGKARVTTQWALKREGEEGRTGNEEQRRELASDRKTAAGRPTVEQTAVDVGDEAVWTDRCELVVRDGNLMLSVWSGDGPEVEQSECRADAEAIARAALKAVPAD
ncbi:serine/threonine-protein kinase [Streptomyces sp. NBC_00091]|uniref:serine/threonine-protein kinase n=1 Tax=Streptomyces sp. NBC_00091 TaxID=2975648 RepID=UPI0022531A72|nr:serine/threonine-protein kinase [Streptomyces sp. NBC_00091]MCX5378600.1 serine/threonine protein kinase [Streptomyces sp. NBC_00091]